MKILEIFGENRPEFIEKCKVIKICWMISIGQVKQSKLHARFCAFGPKMKRILRFFDQNLYGKFTFYTISYQIFLGFLRPPRTYRPLEDNTRFLQFFRFGGGGGRSGVPPPSRRYWYYCIVDVVAFALNVLNVINIGICNEKWSNLQAFWQLFQLFPIL